MKKRISFIKIVSFVLIATFVPTSATLFARDANPITVVHETETTPGDTTNRFLANSVRLSGLLTHVMPDGTVTVMDRENAAAHIFSPDLQHLHSISFEKPLEQLGAFTRDAAGNFFIFFAQQVEQDAFNERNMVLQRYSAEGYVTAEYWLEAQTDDERWSQGYSGVMSPFMSGTARIELSAGMVAVYFARRQFRGPDGANHQASWGFILDAQSFERLTGPTMMRMPSSGHSFNQFILPVSDGFVTASHGDATPRAFGFTRVTPGEQNRRLDGFTFPGAWGANFTGAEMGELAETPTGFIFSGTFNGVGENNETARNLFVQTINSDLTAISDPIWLTAYVGANIHAVSPKIVRIDERRYLVMWEEFTRNPQDTRTFMSVIDYNGVVLSPPQEIEGVPLNGHDVLRYSDVTGRAYWAVRENGNIRVYGLNPDADVFMPPTRAEILAQLPEMPSNWAENDVADAILEGIVPANLQTNFTSATTRAEFAALATALYERIVGIEITGRMQFNDTDDVNVQKMGYLGVVTGIGGGLFDPSGALTREQAAVMLARLAVVMELGLMPSPPGFSDNDLISSWALESVGLMQQAEIMGGTGYNMFSPQSEYTREQSIATILRLLRAC